MQASPHPVVPGSVVPESLDETPVEEPPVVVLSVGTPDEDEDEPVSVPSELVELSASMEVALLEDVPPVGTHAPRRSPPASSA